MHAQSRLGLAQESATGILFHKCKTRKALSHSKQIGSRAVGNLETHNEHSILVSFIILAFRPKWHMGRHAVWPTLRSARQPTVWDVVQQPIKLLQLNKWNVRPLHKLFYYKLSLTCQWRTPPAYEYWYLWQAVVNPTRTIHSPSAMCQAWRWRGPNDVALRAQKEKKGSVSLRGGARAVHSTAADHQRY